MARPTTRDVWVVILGAAVIAEARSLRRRDGATLSEFTRATFRTHTPVGRVAFSAALGIGAGVFWRHILKPIAKELS
jgi:hypothetical protein